MARDRVATRSEDVVDITARLEPYLVRAQEAPPVFDELMERAVTFVAAMPPHQRRATVEELVCPHDRERGRRAVDALIEAAFVAEDERGCLRLLRRA